MSIADKLVTIAENQQKVYDAGKQAEYDRFWDGIQSKGSRTDYYQGFRCWNADSFRPKYDMLPQNAGSMFAYTKMQFSLIEELEQAGVVLDTGSATDISGIFWDTQFTETPLIIANGCKNINHIFYQSRKLRKASLYVDEKAASATGTFQNCELLEDFTVDGTIACTVNFQWSPLSPASMKSIILHLKNFTDTGSDYSTTLTFSEDCWTALETDSTAPDGGYWRTYVYNVLSWNV